MLWSVAYAFWRKLTWTPGEKDFTWVGAAETGFLLPLILLYRWYQFLKSKVRR